MVFNFKVLKSIIALLVFTSNAFASAEDNPCTGANTSLLSLVDRPTVGDSACVVPAQNSIVEFGYQYQSVYGGGTSQNAPQAVYRLGLANQFEAVAVIPNYIHQNFSPKAGFIATTLGIKHQLAASQQWVATMEELFTLPSGSSAYGSKDLGAAINGIFSYNLTSQLSLTAMLGISSQSEPVMYGGRSYSSINPDVVLSWTQNRTDLYLEIYGQTKTGPDEGNGFNMDGGILYLVRKNITIDFEVGQRLNGDLNGFNQYIGFGAAVQFN